MKRTCPECGKEIIYASKASYEIASKKNTTCNRWCKGSLVRNSAQNQKYASYCNKLRKKIHVWSQLLSSECVDCKERNILFLEFDHILPKNEWISYLIRRNATITEIDEEIKLCEVRCIGCHRLKTQRERPRIKVNSTHMVLQRIVREHLETHSCVDCGEDCIDLLDFDHVRGTKRMSISCIVGHRYGVETLMEEIAKCEIVCVLCHRIRTAKRDRWVILDFMKNPTMTIEELMTIRYPDITQNCL